MSKINRIDTVPIPPKDADVLTTCCDYCIVGCGYKIYRWPLGKRGGIKANRNAFGKDLPIELDKGGWVAPNMHNVVSYKGKPHHVVVAPDADIKVVNKGGDHSIRGGAIAQKCYSPGTPTRDRLKHPQVRLNGQLRRISWDDAAEIFAAVSKYVIKKYGVHAWAQKMYSYQYFENTYALTKFALRNIGTPAFAWHDNPTVAPSVPGLRDAGIEKFSASYEDWYLADTLVIAGTDPFETKTIIWNEWIMKAIAEHQQKVICINPRKTTGVAFAEEKGGLHLQLTPGTATPLFMAIARVILENGWEDREWINKNTNTKWETDSGFGQGTRNTDWQWRTTWDKLQTKGFEDYKNWILSQKESKVEFAAKLSGIDADDIVYAAELMAKPREDGSRPKTSFGLEKGIYWSNNYTNTSSYASLGLLCGAGNRPGQMISRFGGHQRGGVKGGKYPIGKSPEKFGGRRRKPLDLDRWVQAGNVRFAYVVGTTWTGAMAASGELTDILLGHTRRNPHQPNEKDTGHIIDVLRKRVDSGGMVVVHQDIYPRTPIGTEIADLVLPAATWGECDFSRANGERRIRLYSKFYDPPGEAQPDWWIAAKMAKAMGFSGYDWKDSNDVFEEAARFTRGGVLNYQPLVKMAKRKGLKGHELLRSYGTTGIQGPIRLESGELVGTKRIHDSTLKLPETGPEKETVWPKWLTSFISQSGKANFIKSPWYLFEDFFNFIKPKGDELWVINGRINEIWQSTFDDVERRPYITQRFPENFIEINPVDAERLGIESGDYVKVTNDRIPVQVSGFYGRDVDDLLFDNLRKNGHIKFISAEVKAVAMVMEVPKEGVSFMYFLNPYQPANKLVPRVPDPLTNNYRYKLAVGKIEKIGESPYKHDFSTMTFKSRAII
ncbi:MAG TPA: arsenate reductase (azurin) large subunit [Desulfobacterales bacterium]|nr:arsenate reductase (azurin) large subunit [Desulfobacterales bacterium]